MADLSGSPNAPLTRARTFLANCSCCPAFPGFCCSLGACRASSCCATTRGTFGQRLEDTVQYEKKFGQHLVPLLVEQCVDFIRRCGLTEEGLFRMPGQVNLVKDLQDSFHCEEKLQFDSDTDVHTVASLLKHYLRELPEPVIPFANYEDFLSCGQLLAKDKEEGTWELAKQVSHLPQANYNLLQFICTFLDEVQSYSRHNKMNVQNLATVFGPNILRPPVEDPVTLMEGSSLIQYLMTVMISEHGKIFDSTLAQGSVQLEPDFQRPNPSIDWSSQDGRAKTRIGSLSGARSSVAQISNCNGKGNHPEISLHKSKQTLPTWKCSSLQHRAGSFNHPMGCSCLSLRENWLVDGLSSVPGHCGSNFEEQVEDSRKNWLVDGLSSVPGHCGSNFEEQVEDSNSSHRLSTYDNVPSPLLSNCALGIISPNCSTSFRGVSLAVDSVNTSTTWKGRDCSALNTLPRESSIHSCLSHSEIYLDSRYSKPEGCWSRDNDQSCMEVASKDPSYCSEALQDLIAELKADLRQQRTDHTTNFKRMEEANAELRKQLARLEEELIKAKKKHTVLEIKLRNSERARKNTEKRNHVLQEEMEYFFTTVGTITAKSQLAKVSKTDRIINQAHLRPETRRHLSQRGKNPDPLQPPGNNIVCIHL